MKQLWEYLSLVIPEDHSRQMTAQMILERTINSGDFVIRKVLDFGCGNGRSIDLFSRLSPVAEWTGVDIENSPEVASRVRSDGQFITYDGENLPFPSGSFDLIYSYQVLEHVRKPETVLPEIARCLKKGGLFIGQTSQFEPYHSYSLWNFTVYGFKKIMEDAGFQLLELRPGIDGFTLMQRTYEGRPPHMDKYFSNESPINREIELMHQKKSIKQINFEKLRFCGQFTFMATLLS